jgi:dCTP deaminase
MFWSSQEIKRKNQITPLIRPFDAGSIEQGSYELCMGAQVAVSRPGKTNVITKLEAEEIFRIPAGQFGLLLTEELVSIPHDAIAFISLKTSIKSKGLVNVSGFHVDPGFEGRLKFWVYNAGNDSIRVTRGEKTFLIWFSSFNEAVDDPYSNRTTQAQNWITADDLDHLEGHLDSPSALGEQLSELKSNVGRYTIIVKFLVVIVSGLLLALAQPLFERLLEVQIYSMSGSDSTVITKAKHSKIQDKVTTDDSGSTLAPDLNPKSKSVSEK